MLTGHIVNTKDKIYFTRWQPFWAPQRGVQIILFWVPIPFKEKFSHCVEHFDVLQMEMEDVLRFLAARTHVGGTILTSKLNYSSAKAKVMVSTSKV